MLEFYFHYLIHSNCSMIIVYSMIMIILFFTPIKGITTFTTTDKLDFLTNRIQIIFIIIMKIFVYCEYQIIYYTNNNS